MPFDAATKRAKRPDRPPALEHVPEAQDGRLELVDRADPDNPNRTVRGPRVRALYDTAWRAGQLTDAERQACERYAILCEREAGAREAQDGPSMRRDPWNRAPPLTAVQAIASLRAVHQAVGPDGAALLRLYVRDNLPVPEIARRRGEGRDVAMGRVRAAIRRAAEHWGMG